MDVSAFCKRQPQGPLRTAGQIFFRPYVFDNVEFGYDCIRIRVVLDAVYDYHLKTDAFLLEHALKRILQKLMTAMGRDDYGDIYREAVSILHVFWHGFLHRSSPSFRQHPPVFLPPQLSTIPEFADADEDRIHTRFTSHL